MLEVSGLTRSFGTRTALDDMGFSVARGEVFGFVGANGAGKTTTMRIVLGVLEPDAGSVTWDGRPVGRATRRRIGYMPEERGLYPTMAIGSQLEYLAELHGLDRTTARERSAAWLDRLGLAGRIRSQLQALSLGNQQRVQLAAALVHDPDLLVLDEPFSGLDPVAVDVMSDVLAERAAAGVPVIFSSHQLDLVQRLSDRVGIVSAGRMVACGTVDELCDDGVRRVRLDAPGFDAVRDGVRRIGADGDAELLELDAGVDEHRLLADAVAAGPVREFGTHRARLTDLYRHVTAAPSTEPTDADPEAGDGEATGATTATGSPRTPEPEVDARPTGERVLAGDAR